MAKDKVTSTERSGKLRKKVSKPKVTSIGKSSNTRLNSKNNKRQRKLSRGQG